MKRTDEIIRETLTLSKEQTNEYLERLIEEELNKAPYDDICIRYAFVLGLFKTHLSEMIQKNKERYLDN